MEQENLLIKLGKQLLISLAIVVVPVAIGLVVIAYTKLPFLGFIGLYGLFGIGVAVIRSARQTKVNITEDLQVQVVYESKTPKGLVLSSVIINVIFGIEAFCLYLVFG